MHLISLFPALNFRSSILVNNNNNNNNHTTTTVVDVVVLETSRLSRHHCLQFFACLMSFGSNNMYTLSLVRSALRFCGHSGKYFWQHICTLKDFFRCFLAVRICSYTAVGKCPQAQVFLCRDMKANRKSFHRPKTSGNRWVGWRIGLDASQSIKFYFILRDSNASSTILKPATQSDCQLCCCGSHTRRGRQNNTLKHCSGSSSGTGNSGKSTYTNVVLAYKYIT